MLPRRVVERPSILLERPKVYYGSLIKENTKSGKLGKLQTVPGTKGKPHKKSVFSFYGSQLKEGVLFGD